MGEKNVNAAPVAWAWTTVDRVTGRERRHTSFDRPYPDAYTKDVHALVYAHPEDAPGGPFEVRPSEKAITGADWKVVADDTIPPGVFYGPKESCEYVRDVFNRLHAQ
ncbi:hypothetical protein LCGC14_1746890 [marine sediment metagenome]|uniref:Uncharacterized protein n=1 Tax=marine sediment metagenome TaxID=412755 RepID=A0A0F9K4G4_9ZZZZ